MLSADQVKKALDIKDKKVSSFSFKIRNDLSHGAMRSDPVEEHMGYYDSSRS